MEYCGDENSGHGTATWTEKKCRSEDAFYYNTATVVSPVAKKESASNFFRTPFSRQHEILPSFNIQELPATHI